MSCDSIGDKSFCIQYRSEQSDCEEECIAYVTGDEDEVHGDGYGFALYVCIVPLICYLVPALIWIVSHHLQRLPVHKLQ